MKTAIAFLILILTANAKIITKDYEYKDGETTLQGFVAYNAKTKTKMPAVLVVHEWTGLGEFTKAKAEALAKLGYFAFAADIYGKGVRPNNPKDAGATATIYKSDRKLLRHRIDLALQEVLKQKNVDSSKIGAIGFCFGGTTVLELARAGTNIKGVASFHGGLSTNLPADGGTLKAKILVMHGADDPYVNDKEVADFEAEMRAAKADWQLIKYANAVHSFTNKEAGTDNSKGAAYNESADKRSWIAMQNFFGEIFR